MTDETTGLTLGAQPRKGPRNGYKIYVWALFGFCAGLTALADFFFFNHPLGWTLGAFTITFMCSAAILRPARQCGLAGKALFLLMIGLGLSLIEEPNLLSAVLIMLLLPAYLLGNGVNVLKNVPQWLIYIVFLPLVIAATLFKEVPLFYKLCRRPHNGFRLRAILNLLIPLLFLSVFILLFASANPVFEYYVSYIHIERPSSDPQRIFFWIAVFAGLFGCFRFHRSFFRLPVKTTKASQAVQATPHSQLASLLFSPTIIGRSLILFNVLFLIENGLDIAFLWGGGVLPYGLTYAEYAHHGAYPLMLTALLAGGFVMIALREKSGPAPSSVTTVLLGFWLLQNLFLIISSIVRLNAYVAVYSLTYLRLFALIWMGLVAWGLVLIMVRMIWRKSNRWLVSANLISAFAVLYISCFLDYGGMIARYNVAHCQEMGGGGQTLDGAYLWTLGPSALPAVEAYWTKVGTPPNNVPVAPPQYMLNNSGQYGFSYSYQITQEERIKALLYNPLWASETKWRAWTYRSYRLRKLIHRNPEEIKSVLPPKPS